MKDLFIVKKQLSSVLILLVLFCANRMYSQNSNSSDSVLNDEFVDNPVVAALDSLYQLDFFELGYQQINYDTIGINRISTDSALRYGREEYARRLSKLDSLTPFDLRYNNVVKTFIELYVVKKRELVARVLGLSQYYFPLFEEVLDKHNLPLEFKYLAICESALNPVARSRAGAAGLWQFMYPTGKMFGLKVNSYVDERYDPIKATEAACEYFEHLYKIYGNWELVLAAYNSGPGNVNRAIRRSGGKRTYWEIRPYLPTETRGYVPAFIAVNYAMNYAADHNIRIIPPKKYFFEVDTIHIKRQVSFFQIAKILDITEEDIHMLNPCYRRKVIPVIKGYTNVLTLPSDKIGTFVANEEKIYNYFKKDSIPVVKAVPQTVVKYYRVRSGDNLGSIARRHGCSVSQLKRWNNKRSSRIYPGDRLRIYSKSYTGQTSVTANYPQNTTQPYTNKSKSAVAKSTTSSSGGYKYHVVRRGDSLYKIAKIYGTTISNLKRLNKIGSNYVLHPGEKLKVKKL